MIGCPLENHPGHKNRDTSAGISFNIIAKMGKNEFVSMESLMKICATLNCNVGDIMDFLPESEELQK